MTKVDKKGKTENEKSADILSESTGIPLANCTNCLFYKKITDSRGECTHAIALSARAIAEYEAVSAKPPVKPQYPMFPIITVSHIKDGEQKDERVPSTIASEYGLRMGLVKWPVEYDPIYILFCLMYMTEEMYREYVKQNPSGSIMQ